MEIKPDKSQLINYLYGELDCGSKEKLDEQIAENPELSAEILGIKDTRAMLAQWNDVDMPEPLVIPNAHRSGIWDQTWFRIAAAMMPLLVALAALLWYQQSSNVSQIAQVEQADNQPKSTGLSREEVMQLITNDRSRSDSLERSIMLLQQKLNQLPKARQSNENTKGMLENGEVISKDDLFAALNQFRLETNQTVTAMINDERRQNQVYLDQLVSSLNTYYDTRRDEDLKRIELALTAMQENQQLQRSKTDYLLSELMSNSEPKLSNPNKNK